MLLMHCRIMLHIFWFLGFFPRNDCMYSEIIFHTQIIFWTIHISSEKRKQVPTLGPPFTFNRHILHKAFTQGSSTRMELMMYMFLIRHNRWTWWVKHGEDWGGEAADDKQKTAQFSLAFMCGKLIKNYLRCLS